MQLAYRAAKDKSTGAIVSSLFHQISCFGVKLQFYTGGAKSASVRVTYVPSLAMVKFKRPNGVTTEFNQDQPPHLRPLFSDNIETVLKREEILQGHFAVLLTQQRSATITSQEETSFLAYYKMQGGAEGEPPILFLIGVYPSRDLFTPAGQQFWFKNNLHADPVKFVKHELEVKA